MEHGSLSSSVGKHPNIPIRTGASIDENVAASVDVIIILIFFPTSVFLTGIYNANRFLPAYFLHICLAMCIQAFR